MIFFYDSGEAPSYSHFGSYKSTVVTDAKIQVSVSTRVAPRPCVRCSETVHRQGHLASILLTVTDDAVFIRRWALRLLLAHGCHGWRVGGSFHSYHITPTFQI